MQLVDTSTNALGRVVTGRELVDLPLNGRNFTQLGLLQTGVAPLTAGVATAGGTLRQGQAYAVNGMRPEQNVYLVDGAQNMNRMDGGYALKLPVDAIAEFRILTQSAPPEYGGTGGATTSVVTRSGSNQLHGSLYEFVRNDAFDARNFFSEQRRAAQAAPVRRHGRRADAEETALLFFGYYEGLPQRSGHHDDARRCRPRRSGTGDFSDLGVPLLNIAAGGVPFPGNQIPAGRDQSGGAERAEPVSARQRVAVDLSRDAGRHAATPTRPARRVDVNPSPQRSALRALFVFGRPQHQSRVGARHRTCRAFRRATTLGTHSAAVSEQPHPLAVADQLAARARYLRHKFFFDQRLNQTPPSALGFGYDVGERRRARGRRSSTSAATRRSAARSPVRATRRRTRSRCRTRCRWTQGAHLFKFGGEFQRTGIDMFQAIAPNAFFVFAGTFPTNNAVANLLLGAPVTFYQGLGDFSRGAARLERRRLRAGRVARRPTAHVQLRPALRAHQSRSPRSRTG